MDLRLLGVAGISALALVASSSSIQAGATTYPAHFIWGVAYSAHQTEGVTGGGENGDWYKFEHPSSGVRSPIANGNTADVAVDEWNRYDEDLQLAAGLGVQSVRTSLAWEKIEPAPGVFSTAAMQHYRAVFQRMHELGIRPMIALHHFTHPQWFNDRGGWLAPDSPKLFLDYATYVVDQLGDLCDLWITFNEPIVLVSMAYLKGQTPPQFASLDSGYEAAFNLARAHRMVAAMIHLKQGFSPNAMGKDGALRGVGLANSLQIYDPHDPSNPMDQKAAEVLADLNNWAFIRGVLGTELKFDIPAEVPNAHSFEQAFPAGDLPAGVLGPALDWIGVNYYTQWEIAYEPTSALRAMWITPEGATGDSGGFIYPGGLERILRDTATNFPGVPLIVSENGLADGKDALRPQFIRDHLASLDNAITGSSDGPGLDVRAYYHWSLMDNFEWLSGYQYQFGLVEIQFDNGLKRVPRPSAQVYAAEIRSRQ